MTLNQQYEDLVKLARICMREARKTTMASVAAELTSMAREYQQRAADLDGGKIPMIDEP